MEERLSVFSLSQQTIERFGGKNHCFGPRFLESSGKIKSCRPLMFWQLLPAQVSNDRVVPAMNIAAFWDEITTLQQLRSVFLQKPLNRFRARFVRTDVDIANALRHARNSNPKRAERAIFTARKLVRRRSKRLVWSDGALQRSHFSVVAPNL